MPEAITHHILVVTNNGCARLLRITAESKKEAMIEAALIGRSPVRLYCTVRRDQSVTN
jgi:hypothetical protein